MGRWSQTEYDRVLVRKVKTLYDSCQDALVESDDTDMRFHTFIKTLNPKDKRVQSVFRTLIQQSHYSNAAAQGRANRQRPIAFEEQLASLSRPASAPRPIPVATFDRRHAPVVIDSDGSGNSGTVRAPSPPPRVHTRTLRRAYQAGNRPGGGVPAPEILRARSNDSEDIARIIYPRGYIRPSQALVERAEVSPLLPRLRPTLPNDVPGSAATTFMTSRAASPSRMRRLGLDPSAPPFNPGARARSVTPPSAASQAWLSEYAAPLPNSSLSFDLDVDGSFGSVLGRRRREEDVIADDGPRTQRRRLSHMPPRTVEAEAEMEALFGSPGPYGPEIPDLESWNHPTFEIPPYASFAHYEENAYGIERPPVDPNFQAQHLMAMTMTQLQMAEHNATMGRMDEAAPNVPQIMVGTGRDTRRDGVVFDLGDEEVEGERGEGPVADEEPIGAFELDGEYGVARLNDTGRELVIGDLQGEDGAQTETQSWPGHRRQHAQAGERAREGDEWGGW